MKIKALGMIVIAMMISLSASANDKELSYETKKRVSAVVGYVVGLASADPVLVAQKGYVKDAKVIKVVEINDTSTTVTISYEFNDNVNGKKKITDVVLIEDIHSTMDSIRSLGMVWTNHRIAIVKRVHQSLD